jgi:hypothetical protein
MKLHFLLSASMLLAALWPVTASAAVVVLANRTPEPITLEVIVDDQPAQPFTLGSGDSRPLFAASGIRLRVTDNDGEREFPLDADSAYYVGARPADGALAIRKIGLGETVRRPWKRTAPTAIESPHAGVVNVKVLVDDDEVRPRQAWEPAIRERIEKASAILDAHCGIRLRITAIDAWDTDDRTNDFQQSLSEFELEVLPSPADVAIGFTSQYVVARGRVHLGGTRGPLHSHILIKERSPNVLETERLELLVHELGHHLAASHSPEPHSVMRPLLAEALQRRAGATVQFDPPNTLLMSLLAEEMGERRVRDISAVTPETRRRMREIYAAIEPTLPNDPAASQYVNLMSAAGAKPLVEDARKILQQIVRVAKVQKKIEDRAAAAGGAASPPAMTGDQLLEFYVRQAAFAAKQVRRENANRALVLALGVALDDAGALRKLSVASNVIRHIESESQRADRLASLRQPTMRGRADLAKHFFVSAHLVALSGSETARGAGLIKELLDAHGGSGFSFADMAANRAGIVFAHALLGDRLTIDDIAKRFTVEAFLPPVDDFREQLGAQEFIDAYGGPGDARLSAELTRIESRIMALPVYRIAPANAGP